MAPKTIMVVDDEMDVREVLAEFLRFRGYEVSCAADGKAAVALLDAVAPDLVLLDVTMPHADGIQTLKQIRAENVVVPVVIVTACVDQDVLSRAIALGAAQCVAKPVSLPELDAVVRMHLNAGSAHAPDTISSARLS